MYQEGNDGLRDRHTKIGVIKFLPEMRSVIMFLLIKFQPDFTFDISQNGINSLFKFI